MKLYHWFIPNKKNNFHPIALRTSGLAVFLIIFSLLPLTYNLVEAKQARVLGYAISITIGDLNSISNQQRANAGLAPLTLNSQLNSAAYAKSQDMFADDYWAHVAPDGATPWSFILAAGYNYAEAGENLAKNFNTSAGVVNGWMNSPEHAANVLKTSYTDVGYGVVNGILQGEETTLVVAMYGDRASAPAPAAATSSSTPTKPQSSNTHVTTKPAAVIPTKTTAPSPTTTAAQQPDQTKPAAKNSSPLVNNAVPTPVAAKDSSGVVEGVMSSPPVQLYSSFNWGQKASLLLLCTILLLFVLKHTLIWREQKRGLRHIWLRAHPIGQIVILLVAIVATLTSSVGVVL